MTQADGIPPGAVARQIATEFCRRLAAELGQSIPPYTVIRHLQASAFGAGVTTPFRTDLALRWLRQAGLIYRVPNTSYMALRKQWERKLQRLDFETPIVVRRRRRR